MKPSVLLVNPWIYDFGAFDLWAKPLGLLYIAAWLRRSGFQVRLVDCLDRHHPRSGAPQQRPAWATGTGQWARTPVPLPRPLTGIPRRFSRYGLPVEAFREDLLAGPRPDLIMVTSGMTYWYPGVQHAIGQVKNIWPDVPLVLGGTYATLCREHAEQYSGADIVVSGAGGELPDIVADRTPVTAGELGAFDPLQPGGWPALDLYPRLDFAPLMTSRGCPGRCPYCASRQLTAGFLQRPVDDVLSEIQDRYQRLGLTHFAFFDDALLIRAESHLTPILSHVVRQGWPLRFHAPNGLHVGLIDPELARLMRTAGFQTIRLGLETLDPTRGVALGSKVEPQHFENAVANLLAAGFDPKRIGVYILFGLPNQPLDEVLSTARAVRALGVVPYLAEYSPLPGTPLWPESRRTSPFDLAGEPLYQNNLFFPCRGPDFSWDEVWRIKREAKGTSAK